MDDATRELWAEYAEACFTKDRETAKAIHPEILANSR